MRIIYKPTIELAKHCGYCGKRLSGDGSIVSPHKCTCGEWERVKDEEGFNYKLK